MRSRFLLRQCAVLTKKRNFTIITVIRGGTIKPCFFGWIISLALVFAVGCGKKEGTESTAPPKPAPEAAAITIPEIESFELVKAARAAATADEFNAKYEGKEYKVKNLMAKTVWWFEDKPQDNNISALGYDPTSKTITWGSPSKFKGEDLKSWDTDYYLELYSPEIKEGQGIIDSKEIGSKPSYEFFSLIDVIGTIEKQDGGNTLKLSKIKIVKK